MNKYYEKIFTNLKSPEPPENLFNKVMSRIRQEKNLLTVKRRMAVFSAGLISSAVAIIASFRVVESEMIKSGFIQFASLIFSDMGTVLSNWQNFVLALLESLPVVSIAVFLLTIFAFLQSLKFLARDSKVFFRSV